MSFMSESTTSCSLLLRCFEEQGSGQFSHYFFFFLKKKSLPKFLVNVISLWDIWGGGGRWKRQLCFIAPGQKASRKPLNGVRERKSSLRGDRGDQNCPEGLQDGFGSEDKDCWGPFCRQAFLEAAGRATASCKARKIRCLVTSWLGNCNRLKGVI